MPIAATAAATIRSSCARFRSRRCRARGSSAIVPCVKAALLDAALEIVADGDASSLHVLFIEGDDRAACERPDFIARKGVQFHWHNDGYRDFDDFLSRFSHDKRKKVKQDRRRVRETGVTFRRVTGHDIGDEDLAFFFRCYEATYRAHRSTPYLTPRVLRAHRARRCRSTCCW